MTSDTGESHQAPHRAIERHTPAARCDQQQERDPDNKGINTNLGREGTGDPPRTRLSAAGRGSCHRASLASSRSVTRQLSHESDRDTLRGDPDRTLSRRGPISGLARGLSRWCQAAEGLTMRACNRTPILTTSRTWPPPKMTITRRAPSPRHHPEVVPRVRGDYSEVPTARSGAWPAGSQSTSTSTRSLLDLASSSRSSQAEPALLRT